MRVRRVVTGEGTDGRSFVVEDGEVDGVTVALFPGAVFHRIWGSDQPVRLPSDGTAPDARAHFPPPDGFRFSLFTMAPDEEDRASAPDEDAAQREIRETLPGLLDVLEPGTGGRHRTDTIDLNLILSGEVWLLLDDDNEVLLVAGDCVVQNGARHAWSNRATEPCVMVVAQIGAARA